MGKQTSLFTVPEDEQLQTPINSEDFSDMLFDIDDDPVKRSKQKRLLWDALQGRPKTRMELAVETGIMRSSICAIIYTWLNEGRVYITGRAPCPITKHKAQMLTANRKKYLESFSNLEDTLGL
jgi:hypothetical protein